jgi:PleD family two-component response regulator
VIADQPFNTPDGREIAVTASFGLSVCLHGDETDSVSLIDHADLALYDAKNCWRNRICSAGAEMLDTLTVA